MSDSPSTASGTCSHGMLSHDGLVEVPSCDVSFNPQPATVRLIVPLAFVVGASIDGTLSTECGIRRQDPARVCPRGLARGGPKRVRPEYQREYTAIVGIDRPAIGITPVKEWL